MTGRKLAVPGFEYGTIGGADVLARDWAFQSVRQVLEEAGSLYEFARANPDSRSLQGRGTVYVIPSPAARGEDARWLVRHLSHGGFLAPITRDLFLRLGTPRPFNELLVSVQLSRAGIATPDVVASVVYPVGPFYRGDVARRWIPNAEDLATSLFGPDGTDPTHRAAALKAAGALVNELHEAGVFHPDLNARNILIETTPEGPRAHILDLEKCSLGQPLEARRREAMLERLRRSFRKLETASGRSLGEEELEAFREGYE